MPQQMSVLKTVQIPPKRELAQSPYRYLLDEPDFMRWYKNVKRGSVGTAHEWVRRFGLIHKRFGKLPADIAKMNAKEAGDFLLDMVSLLEDKGKSGSYISNCVKPVKNWLQFNDIFVQKKIKIPNKNKLTKVGKERVPTQQEVGRIIGAGDYRSKTMCCQMAFSGFREEVFGDSIASDGLTIKDLPEMTVDEHTKKVTFTKVPTMAVVRDSLSKAGHQYFTFLACEGCEYLARLLETRMENGEVLNEDSPIITQTKLTARNKIFGFLRTSNLAEYIKKPITGAGFDWRPYVLRRYFDTRMMLAEADGIIIKDWRTFWMGHKGNIEAVYTVNKGLSDDVIERMRAAYAQAAEKYLMTTAERSGATQDIVRAEMYRTVLEMAHFRPEEIEALGDLSKLDSGEISKLLEDRQKTKLGLNGNNQRVVLMSEVERYILDGWEYVRDLPPSKAIIKLPTRHAS